MSAPENGYTLYWRKRWCKGYHKDHLLWVMMDYFIDFANHCGRKKYIKGVGEVEIMRGQHLFGTLEIANFLGATRQQIRTRLELMKKVGFLTIETTNKYSIATICNYDKYQIKPPTDQPADQPMLNQQLTTPNKLNTLNTINNTPPTPPRGAVGSEKKSSPYTQEFNEFWDAYPKKVGKGAAWKAWEGKKKIRPALPEILVAVKKQSNSSQWQKDGGQYIPNPATWLNQARWDDEIDSSGRLKTAPRREIQQPSLEDLVS